MTTVGGLFAGTVAEQAFALLLSLTRRSSEFRALQLVSTWKPLPVRELEEMTLGIVGLGNIGRAVAKRAKSFGMRVLAARRVAEGMGRDVDAIFSFAQLKEMLSQAVSYPCCRARARRSGEAVVDRTEERLLSRALGGSALERNAPGEDGC